MTKGEKAALSCTKCGASRMIPTRELTALRDVAEAVMVKCNDCLRDYNDPGFPDLVIPNSAWRQISPTGDEGGLLCPSCLCARLEHAGIRCEGAFMSGPIKTVSRPLMTALRQIENLIERMEPPDEE